MKALYKILPLFAAGALLVSCNEMDTAPNGSSVTDDQKDDVIKRDPAMISAGVATLPSMLKQMQNTTGGHDDYGIASLFLQTDARTADFMSYNVPFNWYSSQLMYTDNTDTSTTTNMTWQTLYNLIFTVNNVLITLPEDLETEDADVTAQNKFYAAQAYAFRAYAYFLLAQRYQFTYKGNEDKLCVPLYDEMNMKEMQDQGGAPRATVQAVYSKIMDDLNSAIELLDDAVTLTNGKNYKTANTAESKIYINQNVAYGLRARVNLVMNNWSDAASDADKCIQLSQAAGLTPFTREELAPYKGDNEAGWGGYVLTSGFWDGNDHNWLWNVNITKDDYQYQWTNINFVSFMSSFSYSGGYTTLGAWRYAGVQFYKDIPNTDVRKMWWINPDGDPINYYWYDASTYKKYVRLPDVYFNWVKNNCKMSREFNLLSVKFNRRDGMVYGSDGKLNEARMGDYPLMRIEEMYLIKAEAEAMAGNPGAGAQTLVNFVQTYRDPAYTVQSVSAEGVQDAVWKQRRIELWGEGFAYFDLMRLKKGVDRRGQGFQPESCYNLSATDNVLILRLPRGEVDQNPQITENNPYTDKPTVVADPESYSWDW